LGLFLQIAVFLIVAAALGFAVGWLLRGTRLEEDGADASESLRTRLASAEQERDRLRGELAAAREAHAAAERAQGEAEQSAAAGDPELKARATRLQRELEEARASLATQKSEIERLEMVVSELEVGAAEAPATVAPVADLPAADAEAANGGAPPESLPAPDGEPDDLKQISGIGPGIEKTLHELGVFHFRQIAAFTPANVAWVNRRLRFKGRIEREDWIGQARTLMAGGETEFSQRQQARPS
jgi:predicted flap endonuclease-1-like 5' DNA nuclease